MLDVFMLSVVMLNFVNNPFMLCVIMLNVVMLRCSPLGLAPCIICNYSTSGLYNQRNLAVTL